MKTYSIIITILFLFSLAVIFWPNEPSDKDKELLNQRDEALLNANRLQAQYNLTELILHKKEAELLESRSKVERSEKALTKSLANEKVYLRRIKEQTRLMSDLEADSVIKSRYQYQDSIPQRVVYALSELDQCEAIRIQQDSLVSSLRNYAVNSDSLLSLSNKTNKLSRDQIFSLYQALDKDNEIIEFKDKQIRKERKKVKVLGISIPIAVIVGVLIGL